MNNERIKIDAMEYVIFPNSTTPCRLIKDHNGYINIRRDYPNKEAYQGKKAEFIRALGTETGITGLIQVKIVEIVPNFPRRVEVVDDFRDNLQTE